MPQERVEQTAAAWRGLRGEGAALRQEAERLSADVARLDVYGRELRQASNDALLLLHGTRRPGLTRGAS
jgi:hypothetical protein